MTTVFTRRVREMISRIPYGYVSTYGVIAEFSGNGLAARQVSRILHSSSRKYHLPWHRVVNRNGKISLPPDRGGGRQRELLETEGVEFDHHGRIDLEKYLWWP